MTPAPATLAFVDCETTGLDPDRHEIWEVALILRPDGRSDQEYVWQLPVDLGRADPVALSIGGFYERRVLDSKLRTPSLFAQMFARLTHGAHLVGAVPSFDAERLAKLLQANGACPGWHYHLIDVEALALGWLATEESTIIRPPWKSADLTDALGLKVDEAGDHTALGDARWARAIYDRIMAAGPALCGDCLVDAEIF